MWGGNTSSIDILVKPNSINKVDSILRGFNIQYEVLIEDLQKAIDEENPPEEPENNDRKGNNFHSMHFGIKCSKHFNCRKISIRKKHF